MITLAIIGMGLLIKRYYGRVGEYIRANYFDL